MASPLVRPLAVALMCVTAVVIVTGTVVTGTGPHAGEEDVRRWGFDISTVARIHSMCVLAAVAVALALAVKLRREPTTVRHRSTAILSAWMFIAVLQGGVGYVQYFTGVPEILVAAHIAGATGLWVATVWLALELTRHSAVVEVAEVDSAAAVAIHVASASDMGKEPGRWTQSWRVWLATFLVALAVAGICRTVG